MMFRPVFEHIQVISLSYEHVLRLMLEPFHVRGRGVLLIFWRNIPRSPQHRFWHWPISIVQKLNCCREVHIVVMVKVSFIVVLARPCVYFYLHTYHIQPS